jgi:NAD-dependent deacetylase
LINRFHKVGMSNQIEQVGQILSHAARVLFITGAGVSAESGIPTFRGATAAYPDGRTEDGLTFEEALSATTFRRNPTLAWKYFSLLEQSLRGKRPNPAHVAISALQTPQRYVCVATQNIDGLHQVAGSNFVLELHGNLLRVVCTGCDYLENLATFESLPPLPLCPKCQHVLRPDVVLYEEMLPVDVLERFEEEQRQGFDLVFSVGTTSLFAYVTQPIVLAAREGTPIVEINPDETPISDLADFRFAEGASQVLQAIAQVAAS